MQDNRLMRMLHMLLHVALHDGTATSQTIGQLLGTNPVVVRRTMAGLRDWGLVVATRGRNGGWRLARELHEITVKEIHEALGAPDLVTLGSRSEHPRCPVERAVIATLSPVAAAAEALLLDRLGAMTLSDIARGISPASEER